MFFIILSLIITTAGSLVTLLASKSKWFIPISIMIILVGFSLGIKSAVDQEDAKEESQENEKQALSKLDSLKQAVDNLVQHTLGGSEPLNALTGDSRYYVRLATGNSYSELEEYLHNLFRIFKGAERSGMVAIRNPSAGSRFYELVFGQNLDMVAAESYRRLAMSHHLSNGIALILPETSKK